MGRDEGCYGKNQFKSALSQLDVLFEYINYHWNIINKEIDHLLLKWLNKYKKGGERKKNEFKEKKVELQKQMWQKKKKIHLQQ